MKTLKPFDPLPFAADSRYPGTPGISRRSPSQDRTEYFATMEDAEAYAAMLRGYQVCPREVTLRPCTPEDYAQQRVEDIAHFLASVTEEILAAESGILCQGDRPPDYSPIAEHVREAVDYTTEPNATPMEMGWVGSDGLP